MNNFEVICDICVNRMWIMDHEREGKYLKLVDYIKLQNKFEEEGVVGQICYECDRKMILTFNLESIQFSKQKQNGKYSITENDISILPEGTNTKLKIVNYNARSETKINN